MEHLTVLGRRADERLGRLMQGVEAEGWRFVALVRLVPILPFNLLNYALGLTRIPLRFYIMATTRGMLPGTVTYVSLGYAGRRGNTRYHRVYADGLPGGTTRSPLP